MYNESTFSLLKKSLMNQSRVTLLKKRTALWCLAHQRTEQVTDIFPNGECQLSCGSRRSVVTDPAVIAAFTKAKAALPKTRSTGWQSGTVVTVEEIEQ